MGDWDQLPSVFAQKTDQNDRIISLLSSVLYRRIQPSFTPAIRRHPLSMWTLDADNKNKKDAVPIALIVQEESCPPPIKTIGRALKNAIADSGFVVAELKVGERNSVQRESVTSHFNPQSDVFVITIGSNLLKVECCGNQNSASPSLILISKTDAIQHSPKINRHLGDPSAIVVSLLSALDAYGDDGAKSLWIIRCVLKFMKAAQHTTLIDPLIQSRL